MGRISIRSVGCLFYFLFSLSTTIQGTAAPGACRNVSISSAKEGDFDINDPRSGSGNTNLEGNTAFRILRPDRGSFFLDRICFKSTSSQVKIIMSDQNGNDIGFFKFDREGDAKMDYCVKDEGVSLLSKIVIQFFKSGIYLVESVRVEGSVEEECPASPQDASCGVSKYSNAGVVGGAIPSPSIVNGWEARPNEFPWQVALKENGEIGCGGSIIDSSYILTAAHCFPADIEKRNKITVYVGEHSSNETGVEFEVTVLAYIIHEDYVLTPEDKPINDIALLHIEEISEWTDSVAPICMPTEPFTEHIGESVIVSGWGSLNEGILSDFPDKLNYVNVGLISVGECNVCMKNNVTDGMLCAGVCGPNPVDSCQGDSGGPLVRKKGDGTFELTGVVSWGWGCASDTPGVYADVYYYKDWILAHTPDADISFE